MNDAFPTVGGTGLGRALSEQGVRRPQEQERCPGRLPQRCALHSPLAHSAQPLCRVWERSSCFVACWRRLCARYASPLCIASAQLPTTAASSPALQCFSKVSECNAGLVDQSNSISLHLWSAHAPIVHAAVWSPLVHMTHPTLLSKHVPCDRRAPAASGMFSMRCRHVDRVRANVACAVCSQHKRAHAGVHPQQVKQSARSLSASMGVRFGHVLQIARSK